MTWTEKQKTNMQSLLDALAVRGEAKRRKKRQERMEKVEGVLRELRPLNKNPEYHFKRFFDMVTKTDGCWRWLGSKPAGYGKFEIFQLSETASRISYQIEYGTISETLDVCHSCDNPECTNPDHLFLGTAKDNARDASKKGRLMHGERHIFSILNECQVVEIRRRYKFRKMTHRMLASEFGVSREAIGMVVRNKNWRHVCAG